MEGGGQQVHILKSRHGMACRTSLAAQQVGERVQQLYKRRGLGTSQEAFGALTQLVQVVFEVVIHLLLCDAKALLTLYIVAGSVAGINKVYAQQPPAPLRMHVRRIPAKQ